MPQLLNEFNKGTGAQFDIVDTRDFQWYPEIAAGSPAFDWTKGFDIEKIVGTLPVKDQGVSLSCGGQAWSSYAGVLEAVDTGTLEERSAKFIYAQTFVHGGGSAGRTNSELYKNQGVSRETICPSGPHDESFYERPQDITVAARQDAKLDKAKSYANVETNIDLIAQAIRDNYGVVLGITGSNNGTWLDGTPVPPVDGEAFWYHWVYAGKVKMVNGRKFIGILNSWGTDTGQQGWQWLSPEYFSTVLRTSTQRKAVWQCWTHIYNPYPVTVPVHLFFKDLVFGDMGEEIKFLQEALQANGCFPNSIPPTSYFGPITLTAVQKFQVKYRIAAPGIDGYGRVGPKTRTALNNLSKMASQSPNPDVSVTNMFSWIKSWF